MRERSTAVKGVRWAGAGHRTREPDWRSYQAGSPAPWPDELIPGYDHAGVMSGGTLAAYADIVKQTPGQAPVGGRAGLVARRAWRGLIQVLAGPDAPPAWWYPPWPRRAYL